MSLAPGTRLGPYDVTAPLGAGGMGEVYRARDGRLSRDVAVKVLPASFAADAERLRRFEQEARAAGLLNHPNILQVHDVGTHDGAPYVVSELLEGETLRERIGGTPMPARKAIDLASQIARGLAAAHQKGIIHRDLKPDNVFVTSDGRAKILDFGLAKLAGDAMADAETHTRGTPGTDAGKVLGTVGYMSPEQVRARPVDHRSDIFSFGSVLYEMLSGQRAFRGSSAVETMNAILKEDPPELSATNRRLPAALERIVAHCLEKNPDERFQSASDIAFDLEQLSGAGGAAEGRAPGAVGRLPRRLPLAGALLAMALIAAASFLAGQRSVPATLPAFRAVTFQRGTVTRARYVPDRRTVVYGAQWGEGPLDIYEARPGSPESRSLGLTDAALAAVSRTGEMALLIVRGRPPGRTLARKPMGSGAPRDVTDHVVNADWAPDASSLAVVRLAGGRNVIEYPVGTPLYAGVYVSNIRVAPSGDRVAFADHPMVGDNRGDVAVVDKSGNKRTLSSGWSDIRGLAWSPDGREVWFSATRSGTDMDIWAVTLDGRERAVYRGPGSIVIQDTTEDGRVLASVMRGTVNLFARAPGASHDRDVSWLDWGYPADLARDGKALLFTEQGEGGGPQYSTYIRGTDGSAPVLLGKGNAFALSADGALAVVLSLGESPHLDLLPTGAGEPRSLPAGSIVQFHAAAFCPDGRRIVISGNEKDRRPRIFLQDLAGGDPRPVSPEGVSFSANQGTNPITADGAGMVGRQGGELMLFPVAGGAPTPVKGSQLSDVPLRFGADGRSLYVRTSVPGQGLHPPVRIVRIDLETGAREPWVEIAPPGPPYAMISVVLIAPEARAYAYSYTLPVAALYEASGIR